VISKDLIAASSRPVVLSILAAGESYGYAIIQEVSERSGGEVEWTEGMLYPVLHRLEKEGLITSSWQVGDSGRRRKYYHLNKQGRTALAAEQSQWRVVDALLGQLWNIKPCRT